MDLTPWDAVVVGGGAAGLFGARTAGLRGRRVLVLEAQARLGNKILISGGGRCNFTNTGTSPDNYLTQGSLDFPRSALARFGPGDFLDLVERHGIGWHEKKLGQLFCDHSSKEILRMLESECARAGVVIWTGCGPTSVVRVPDGSGGLDRWAVETPRGVVRARSLVVATGGLSFPRLGATPFGYDLARRFGVPVIPPRPGLVPLTWNAEDREGFADLSGVSLDCEVGVEGHPQRFREHVLFTHRGLSGPAILQASSYWRPGARLRLNLLPGRDAMDFLNGHRAGGRDLRAALRRLLPERFVERWCARHASRRPLGQMSRAELDLLAGRLRAWEVIPAGDEGFAKAEVTVGGVETRALSSRTLECRDVPGLYFVGEVVDVTGWLGGYNFQWAWASGHAAGMAI